MGRYDSLVEKIKTIDTEVVKDWNSNTDPEMKVLENQRVYIWIRLYLKEESNIEIGDDITMLYRPSGEKISIKFICYDKTSLTKDHDDMEKVINFNPEDDKKVLCLMVDENQINTSDEIPFIRTLFKTSRHYKDQLVRRDDLVFINERNGDFIEYYDCSY
jgi:hypothetical protein